jgi:hypothetical protein
VSTEAEEQLKFDLLGAFLSVKAKLASREIAGIEYHLRAEGAQNISQFRHASSAAFGFTQHGHACIVFRGTQGIREFVATDLNLFVRGCPPRMGNWSHLFSLSHVRDILFQPHHRAAAYQPCERKLASSFTLEF